MKTYLSYFQLRWLACTLCFSANAAEPKPLSVPQLEDLVQPWIFVRASEASTLFIDKEFKGAEPYGHLLVLEKNKYQWLEFDGRKTSRWDVSKVDRNEKQLTMYLVESVGTPDQKPARLVVYPYWDIDHCLVMIRFDPGAEENPVRFATPYALKNELPYGVPER